jgi:hypothetical protein
VDGTEVIPTKSEHPPAVPLEDGSIIEIRKKRFEYNYPPKDYRFQAVIDSPAGVKRSLRMSMIEAAQIFTPTAPRVMPPPLLAPRNIGVELVSRALEDEGQNSVVIESEKDLIVVEEEEEYEEPLHAAPLISRSSSSPVHRSPPQVITPQRAQRIITTPRRRSEPSLHKAVLIRSAQRAFQESQEKEREAIDEQEVELTISPTHFSEDEEDEVANGLIEIPDLPDDIEEGDETLTPSKPTKGSLRRSFEAVKGILPIKWMTGGSKNADEDEEANDKEEEVCVRSDFKNGILKTLSCLKFLLRVIVNTLMTKMAQTVRMRMSWKRYKLLKRACFLSRHGFWSVTVVTLS